MKFENIKITAEGVWLHEGVEITHEKTINLFKRSVYFKNGKYFLSGEKVPVPVEVEDVAFFVIGVANKHNEYWIKLSDGTEEKLDYASLDLGSNNALYCLIKDGKTPAKFERKVYNELMKHLDQRSGYYGLVVNGLFYPIQSVTQDKPTEKAIVTPSAEIPKKAAAKKSPSKKQTKIPKKKKPTSGSKTSKPKSTTKKKPVSKAAPKRAKPKRK